MTDQELADAIVALGVGKNYGGINCQYSLYDQNAGYSIDHGEDILFSAESFVRDWRVTGALMEKAVRAGCIVDLSPRERSDMIFKDAFFVAEANTKKKLGHQVSDDCAPRAICEACVEALQ